MNRLYGFETEWQAYTRQFIAIYNLNIDQAERAEKILNSCEERAHAHLRRKQGEGRSLCR